MVDAVNNGGLVRNRERGVRGLGLGSQIRPRVDTFFEDGSVALLLTVWPSFF